MVFSCFADAPGLGFGCLTVHCFFRSSESDVRGWVYAFWDLKYMVFGCFAGAPGRGFGCLTVHCL